MRDLREFMDSTYLKTAAQAGVSEAENNKIVVDLIQEAIDEKFKLAMIRPEQVKVGRKMVDDAKSKVLIGTVIDFPEGNRGLEAKLKEAKQAVADGVDELDYVVDYTAFQKGNVEQVKKEVEECTAYGLKAARTVKWILETAALKDSEIVQLTTLIKNVVMSKFDEKDYGRVFVKSSTGFYKTEGGKPNGATMPALVLMVENAGPLAVKASGGIRDRESAIEMINLGITRLGTSAAKTIVDGSGKVDSY
ncbi:MULTISPECIES: deoxyribose-phosphate aldolase [Myroides]|uniref:Deoxyribose-phosphate aldolase n=1 Tax=Myroides albus TaxID=2562892 RepID=A0A6I3LED2_9FLAO|nr:MULTISPECIES: deoxyribose-phosphate aldolase [Myroides]MTG96838.1 deoxyribose-phosphate aldolase [Myroides albus]MVX36943.1 deoxyribose-phosphate aldolase [Myroides sp. LoEW2-1]UVD78412.1 deoxyribose-phosphate aldolase [Myroides albus]